MPYDQSSYGGWTKEKDLQADSVTLDGAGILPEWRGRPFISIFLNERVVLWQVIELEEGWTWEK